MWYDGQPQWERTLQLAHCLVTVPKTTVERKWREHFFLDTPLTVLGVEKFLHPKDFKHDEWQSHWAMCLNKYKAWVAEHGKINYLLSDGDLNSSLDGDYWGNKNFANFTETSRFNIHSA